MTDLFCHGLKVEYAGVARTDDGLQVQHHNLRTRTRGVTDFYTKKMLTNYNAPTKQMVTE